MNNYIYVSYGFEKQAYKETLKLLTRSVYLTIFNG